MGDICSKQPNDQHNEGVPQITPGRQPVVAQPSSTEFSDMNKLEGQSNKPKDKSKKAPKEAKKYTKQPDGNRKDVDKTNSTTSAQSSVDSQNIGGVLTIDRSPNSSVVAQAKPVVTQTNPEVAKASPVVAQANPVVTKANTVVAQTNDLVAQANNLTTAQASSSGKSQTDVNDKDTSRTKSTISACSSKSAERVDTLEDETKDALEKQDVLKTKEKKVQAQLEKAKGNEQESKQRIQQLEEELKYTQEQRKEAEEIFKDKIKELEDAKKELEEENQHMADKYTKMIQEKEEELRKAKQEADDETKKQQQEKLKLQNERDNLQKKYKERKGDHKKKLAEEIATKDAQLKELQKQVNEKERIANVLKMKENDINQLKKEKEELYLRLSAMAGRKLTDNNPNIADLSDQNRPTKLGESYSQIYDNEWTDAFSYLETCDGYQDAEKKGIEVLYQTITIAYQLSLNKANSELKELSHAVENIGGGENSANIKDFLKQMKDSRKKRVLPEEDLQQEYRSKIQKQFPNIPCDTDSSGDWDKYRNACLKICWLMAIQDPPVYLECGDAAMKPGDTLDKGRYKEYTQSGKFIDFPVWPAMYLHKGGSVLSKGVVQCSKMFSSSVRVSATNVDDQVTKKQDNMSKSIDLSRLSHSSEVTQL